MPLAAGELFIRDRITVQRLTMALEEAAQAIARQSERTLLDILKGVPWWQYLKTVAASAFAVISAFERIGAIEVLISEVVRRARASDP